MRDLPHDMDGFCDARRPHAGKKPGRLCEARRCSNASRLEKVEHERALNAGAAQPDLFPSLVIVELEVSRADSTGALQAVAFLSDSVGKSLGKLTALTKEHDVVALAGTLAEEFATHLKAPAGAKVDRLAEAARFYSEAQLWTDASDFFRAVPPAEAAHALCRDNAALPMQAGACAGHVRRSAVVEQFRKMDSTRPPPSRCWSAAREMLPDLLRASFEGDPASGARSRTMLSDAAEGIRRYLNWRIPRSLSVFTAGGLFRRTILPV